MRLAVVVDPSAMRDVLPRWSLCKVEEIAATLDRDGQAAEGVVADGGGRAARHLLLVVAGRRCRSWSCRWSLSPQGSCI